MQGVSLVSDEGCISEEHGLWVALGLKGKEGLLLILRDKEWVKEEAGHY